MINDNFDFKKLLKESIQEREETRAERGKEPSPGTLNKAPEEESERIATSEDSKINTTALEIIAVPGLEDFKKVLDFPASDKKANAKKTKFIKTVVSVWNTVKTDEGTKKKSIPKIKKYIDIFLGPPEEGTKGEGEAGGEAGGEEAATSLTALLLEPVNPEDRSKGFKPKEYDAGSMASRINIALNNLSDPGLKSSYIRFKKKPNASNRMSFMSNLNNLKKALDNANVKIEGMEIKQKESVISELIALFERELAQ